MRVLRNGILLRPDGLTPPLDARTMCGSVASHFDVSAFNVSFYRVSDRVPAETSAIAIASMRPAPVDAEFFVVDEEPLVAAGFVFDENSPGETPCEVANAQHVDVGSISLGNLANLGVVCAEHGRRFRLKANDVMALIAAHIEGGVISATSMNQKLREQITAYQSGSKFGARFNAIGWNGIRDIRAIELPND